MKIKIFREFRFEIENERLKDGFEEHVEKFINQNHVNIKYISQSSDAGYIVLTIFYTEVYYDL